MIYSNILKGKKIYYKKLNYGTFVNGLNTDSDKLSLPIYKSNNMYNFNFNNGALLTGLGIKTLHLPFYKYSDESREITVPDNESIIAVWWLKFIHPITNAKSDKLVFMTKSHKFYFTPVYSRDVPIMYISGLTMTEIPSAINYNVNGFDSMIFSNNEGFYVWSPARDNGLSLQKVESAPLIDSMTIHYERVFATMLRTKDKIWFSKEFDPTNWNPSLNEGGFISLRDDQGQCNKVISFNDYVYIFRDYSINKLTAYANQTEFNLSNMYVSSGQIYTNTICVCGDRIIMLTENGLYCFDGFSTRKLNLPINKFLEKIDNQNSQAVYFNGKYYLSCKINFNDNKKVGCENCLSYRNNTLLEFDLKTNNINILRGVDIISLCPVVDDYLSKLIAIVFYNGEFRLGEIANCGSVFGENLEKGWESVLSDLGYPEKDKILKDVYIKSEYPIEIEIKTEKYTKQFNVIPKNNLIHIRPNIKGKMLGLNIKSKSQEAYISAPKLIVGFV